MPYDCKNGKRSCFTVAAVEAHISKSILPTYGTFPRGRSHMYYDVHVLVYTYYTSFQGKWTERATDCLVQYIDIDELNLEVHVGNFYGCIYI